MDHVLFPRFWKEEPALWFAQVEAVFTLNNITSDTDKYDYILCELPSTVISLIKDLILDSTTEFDDGKYQKIKKELIKRISIADLENEKIGTMKPSEFYKYLTEKADPRVSENVIKEIWLKKLPSQVNYIVCDIKGDMEFACKLADTVKEYIPVSCLNDKTEVISATSDRAKLWEIFGKQMENIYAELLRFKMLYNENNSHLERIQAELYKFKLAYSDNNIRLGNIQAELQQIKSAFLSKNNNDKSFCNICSVDKSDQKHNELDQTDHSSKNDNSSMISESDELKKSTENIELVTDQKVDTGTKTNALCWYHTVYGNNAHNCLAPCNFKTKHATDFK